MGLSFTLLGPGTVGGLSLALPEAQRELGARLDGRGEGRAGEKKERSRVYLSARFPEAKPTLGVGFGEHGVLDYTPIPKAMPPAEFTLITQLTIWS